MSKKISLLIIALCILFSVFFILAQDYIVEETPTPKEDINYYLAKESFNHEELHYVENYLSNLGDESFKDKNLELSKKYLLQVKEQINTNEQTREIAKKYLVNLEEIKPDSDESIIAKEYYLRLTKDKFVIDGSFDVNKDGLIQTAFSSITESDLQKLALREDIKEIKITSLGEIELIQKIGEEELSLKLGENLRFAEFISKDSFRLESKDPLKEAKFEFNGKTYYGNKFLVTKIPEGMRLHITVPTGTKNFMKVDNFDLELEYPYLIEELGKKPESLPERKLTITETLAGIKSITAANLNVKSGKDTFSGEEIEFTKDAIKIKTNKPNVENDFKFKDYDFDITSNPFGTEGSGILIDKKNDELTVKNSVIDGRLRNYAYIKNKETGKLEKEKIDGETYNKIKFLNNGDIVTRLGASDGQTYSKIYLDDNGGINKKPDEELRVIFSKTPWSVEEPTLLINPDTGEPELLGLSEYDTELIKGQNLAKGVTSTVRLREPVTGTIAGLIIEVEPPEPRPTPQDLLIATIREGLTIKL